VAACAASAEVGGRCRGIRPTINTATFSEANARTTLTLLTQTTSRELRDSIIDSGMEAGLRDALNLLEQVASSLR
jgi:hypothetical protein